MNSKCPTGESRAVCGMLVVLLLAGTIWRGQAQTLYSIGQPTDEEQLYLELINRSRANPTNEGVRLASTTNPDILAAYAYFGVNLTMMTSQFATNPVVPPLAFNSRLIDAARWHSGDMFTNMYQAHPQTNGGVIRDPGQRMNYKGYTWITWGENIYSFAQDVSYGHTALNVDWGTGPGGMSSPPGHRNNIHNGSFREIGVGVHNGINGFVGPQLVTQDFATQPGSFYFITGVVYYDLNGDSFYGPGEGIGGVTVVVSNSPFYTVSANSGGFAVPVSSNGNYTVVFSGAGFSSNTTIVSVTNSKNVKVDFVPVYSPPTISGPAPAILNYSNLYGFTAVGGATNYQWLQAQLSAYSTVEGAENGLTNVTVISSPGYSVRDTNVAASGNYSFHLAHPAGADQFLTLNPLFLLRTNSELAFAKRLGWARTGQVARVQISLNGGAWQDLWSQLGTESAGELTFSRMTNSLGSQAGKLAQIRFAYDRLSGTYYTQTTNGYGLYLDDISVSNADELTNQITRTVGAGTSFYFLPTNNVDHVLAVRALLPGRTFDWGTALRTSVSASPAVIALMNPPILLGNQIQIDFSVSNYRSGMTFQLWKTSNPAGSWSLDATAAISVLIPNTVFRATTQTGGAAGVFYRMKGSY